MTAYKAMPLLSEVRGVGFSLMVVEEETEADDKEERDWEEELDDSDFDDSELED